MKGIVDGVAMNEDWGPRKFRGIYKGRGIDAEKDLKELRDEWTRDEEFPPEK